VGYKPAIEMLTEIMNAQIIVPSREDVIIVKMAQRYVNSFITEGIRLKEIQDALPTENTLVQVMQSLDNIITTPDPSNYMYSEKLFARLEKGQIYRAARLRTEAINEFNLAYAFANSEDQPYVEKWRCLTETEHKIITHQLSIDKADEYLSQCGGSSNSLRLSSQAETSTQENSSRPTEIFESEMHFNIYPNPANNELFVAYKLAEETSQAEFKIMNIEGNTLQSVQLTNDKTMITINNLELPSGVYYYHIIADGKIIKTEKLIIMR
jgi:hypothetical protein